MAQQASADQVRKALVKKIHELKAESHNAVNVYKCKEVLQGLLDVVEVILTGRATIVQPNQVPGMPIQRDDTKQHVEFFRTPDQQALEEGGDPLAHGGQRVELFPSSPSAGAPGEPVRNDDAAAGRLVPGAATRSIEAGRDEVPPVPGAPQTKDELIAALPIPVLEAAR
jgi:hypothetical protein